MFDSVEEYVEFLEKEQQKLDGQILASWWWGGSEKGGHPQRWSKYGWVHPGWDGESCRAHGDKDVYTHEGGWLVCRQCRRDYANLRNHALGIKVPGRVGHRFEAMPCDHDGPCDRRGDTLGRRACLAQKRADQARIRRAKGQKPVGPHLHAGECDWQVWKSTGKRYCRAQRNYNQNEKRRQRRDTRTTRQN